MVYTISSGSAGIKKIGDSEQKILNLCPAYMEIWSGYKLCVILESCSPYSILMENFIKAKGNCPPPPTEVGMDELPPVAKLMSFACWKNVTPLFRFDKESPAIAWKLELDFEYAESEWKTIFAIPFNRTISTKLRFF